ncbi:MAG: hypothetical protein A2Y88_01030, partial [Chloroflexi bacterium RBG_13_48_10]
MTQLTISLLGSPQITVDGVPIRIPTARAVPLIAYLALNDQVQSRENLANLLWTDSNQKQALAALRTTLWRLKSAGLSDWIDLDRNEIALNPQKNIEVDVLRFKALLNKCNMHGHPPSQICLYCTPVLTGAIELYRGEFMTGFNISKALSFDDWRMQQSLNLASLHLNALERLVSCHRTFGDFNLAIHFARVWLGYDHLNENAYHQLLQLYSITGQRTAGISLFKHYKEILLHELEIEPDEEMVALYKQIITGHPTPVSKQSVKNPVFLIADIEKAPIYWARAGDKKNEILATYDNILKETARRFGGIVLQKSEDNVTLLFESGQPLHCAVTIHLKLKKADWGELGPPNIRMVLYSTFLEGGNPGNFAMLTHAASSLLSISWGGQIVFTDQTLRLLDVPSGSNLKDLGFHFLNDIEGSIHVFELLHPHLPSAEHPPLQSGIEQLVNFPIVSPPFIGREQELEQLSHLLLSNEDRLISLIGPGGIGKTRLAVQSASQNTEYFPDGVYFISLASIQDPDFIPILIADTLKFSFFGPTDHMEQLAKYLHRRSVLLVIDNFEHLRVEGAKILAFLLARTHQMKILLTSRERLNMISETILEVHGLPVPGIAAEENTENFSSIKLFIHNAKKTFPRFSFQNNIEAIIRICHLVDGNPLGILLASSWVRVFNCFEIATEIKKNIDFLTTSASDIDPRHHSLSAIFDNSWKLLSQEERLILRKLSIFQAPFTPRAAQNICDATPLLLSIYIDKSLLNHLQEDRFELLATFHQYAYAKLGEDNEELVATKVKFCEFYANFCAQKLPELNSPVQIKAMSEMQSELENIHTAWGWMVEANRWDMIDKCKNPLLIYHTIMSTYLQGGELFRNALIKLNKLYSPEFNLIRASMQQLSAWMTFRKGFISEGIQGLTECLDIFRTYKATWDIAMTLYYLAEINRTQGKYSQAKNFIEECLTLMRGDNIPKSNFHIAITAHCESLQGLICLELGNLDQARLSLNSCLSTHNRIGTFYGTIHPLMGLARLACTLGDYLQARDLYLQALDTATNIYDHRQMAVIHNNLSAVYEETADIPESHHHVVTALNLCKETGDRRLTAVILNNLAYQLLKYLDQPAEAIRTYQECLAIFSEIGDLRGITYSSYDVSKAYLKVGLFDETWKYCLQSLHTAMTLDSTPLILHALHGFANLFAHIN